MRKEEAEEKEEEEDGRCWRAMGVPIPPGSKGRGRSSDSASLPLVWAGLSCGASPPPPPPLLL